MFSNILNNVSSIFSNKRATLILFLITLFLGIAYYVYSSYMKDKIYPSYIPNNEFEGATDKDIVDIYFCYANWCPYSQSAKKEWNKVKANFDNQQVNKSMVRFKEIEADENDGNTLSSFENTYLKDNPQKKVEGFPTIYMIKDDKCIEYKEEINEENLNAFVNII